MEDQQVTVTIADDYLGRALSVIRRCEEVGLRVARHLETLGIVVGTIDPQRIADLERVEGVAAVEPDRDIDIGPPDQPVQ